MDRYPYYKYTILLGATRALAHIGIHFTHRVFGLSLPKGTRGGLFYSPQDKKVFVSMNATFLKNDYMENFKP